MMGMDLGYPRLSQEELKLIKKGLSKLHLRGEVPGFAAYYGAYEDPTGDKLQRVISWEQIVILGIKVEK